MMSCILRRLFEMFLIKLCISIVTNVVMELHQTRVVSGHSVRLANGSTEFRGRVEVLYNNSWGTICDDGFSRMACRVICKQLGYRGGVCIGTDIAGCRRKTAEDFIDGVGAIWLDNLTCIGSESTIDKCQHNNWGDTDCRHNEDAGCICERPAEKSGTCDQSRHRILPFDDASPGIGLVQVQDEAGVWGLVCDDKWDDIDATVLCSCLGFNRTNEFHAMYNTKYPVPRDLPIIFDAVHCTLADTERVNNLFDCLVVPSTDNCNPATEPAAVACQSLPLPAITTKPEPTVECSANVMTVCIQSEEEDEENTDGSGEALKTNIASNVEQDNLHLSVTPMCHEVSRTTTHNNTCYIIDMKKCDAIQSEPGDGSNIHYCYDVNHFGSRAKLSPSKLIVDSNTFRACCLVRKHATVSASFLQQNTIPPSFHQMMTSFKYSISCFSNSSFAGEPLTIPAQVMRGSVVYCLLGVDISLDLNLIVPNCSFLSSASPSANSFEFLKDRCLMSHQLGMQLFSFDSHRWGFSFRMPKFESSDEIYLSCDSYLCNAKSGPKERCDRSCSDNVRSSPAASRVRRQIHAKANVNEFHTLDGPFKVKDFGCGPLIVNKNIVETYSDSRECDGFGMISSAPVTIITGLQSVHICLILVPTILARWI